MYGFYTKEQIKKEQIEEILSWSLLLNRHVCDNIMTFSKDGEIIGYITYSKDHINKFEVKQKYQNLGYGKKILESFINYYKLMNEKVLSLLCINADLEKYYNKFGFEKNDELSKKHKELYMELNLEVKNEKDTLYRSE